MLSAIKNIDVSKKELIVDHDQLSFKEATEVVKQIDNILLRLIDFEKKLVDSKRKIALSEIMAQVAHDIRSPLSVLKSMAKNNHAFSEQERIALVQSVIGRIDDIANNLLRKNRILRGDLPEEKDDMNLNQMTSSILISTIVARIIAEKRTLVRLTPKIVIKSHFVDSAHQLFIDMNPNSLATILSNLIDNAIEAIGDIVKCCVQKS